MLFDLFRNKRPAAQRVEPTISNASEVSTADTSRMMDMFGGIPTTSGAVVNERTAMRVAAVYRAVSLLAGTVAMLPLPIFERIDSDTRRQVQNHPYWWILNESGGGVWTSAAVWEFMVAQVLLRGDGIAYAVRQGSRIVGLIPYPRDRVTITRISQGKGRPHRLQYGFADVDGYFGAEQEDVIHFPGFGFNGIESMSVIQWGARNGIGIAIRGDEFAGQSFAHGGKPEIAVTVPGKMSPGLQEDFRQAWVAKYSGSGPNGIPLILTEGLTVKELSLSQADQQVLESRQWQVVDIARAFGVPPHLIGEVSKSTSWGTGLEQQNIAYLLFTLGPHLTRFAHELNQKLFGTARNFVAYDRHALLVGDSTAKGTYYGKALGGPGAQGWMSVDEIRRLENLPPQGGEFSKVTKATDKSAAPPTDDPKPDDNNPPPDQGDDNTQDDTKE